MTMGRPRRTAPLRAFTMTELLVVIGITSILLGLLFIPIIQGFNITRRAQAETQAQSAARSGLERIVREIRSAAYVYDNSASPVALPLNRTVKLGPGATDTQIPLILFAKIDLVPVSASDRGAGDILDPTTGKGLDGGPVRLPVAPGTRVVRYFLGLERNLTPAGASETYRNPYEFGSALFTPRDESHNPVLLYRAEFDPSDANLIDPARYSSAVAGDAGFNDPLFFYNTRQAPNGRSYAANWKAVSSPVVQGPRLDMVVWRKDASGDLIADSPLRTLVRFMPGTVVGDTAVPGHLQASAAEAPAAVPSLYSAKEGQWVLPFTVTFYRAAGGGGTSRPSFGAFQLRFERELLAGGQTRVRAVPVASEGSLDADTSEIYVINESAGGRYFVKTPNLVFAVDPSRGRIETAFPPIAANETGAPFCLSAGGVAAAAPGPYPTVGELVPMVLRLNTRDPQAGVGGIPTNQGLVSIFPFLPGLAAGYVSDTTTALPGGAATPLQAFGNMVSGTRQPGGGIQLVPGSEQVMAPDMGTITAAIPTLVGWHRTPAASGTIVKRATLVDDAADTLAPARKRWTAVTGPRTYVLDQDTQPNEGTRFQFDEEGGPGIPAKALSDPATIGERIVDIRFLWQNNYARRVGGPQNGWAVNSDDQTLFDLAGSGQSGRQSIVPDPDVVKVDYSTRSQIVVDFGVGVYDANTRRATTLQLSDRVRVGNLNR